MKLVATKDTGTLPRFGGDSPEFQVLYADDERRRLWIAVDPKVDWNVLALESTSPKVLVVFDDVPDTARCGLIAFCDSTEDQWISIKAALATHSMPSTDPKDPQPADSLTLNEVVVNVKFIGLLPLIAEFMSTVKGTSKGALIADLQQYKWRNVREIASASVERDERLFSELERRIKKTKFGIILGGRNSGLTIFLNQFRQRHAAQSVTVDFDRHAFERISAILAKLPNTSLGPVASGLHIEAVCATLAFTAHEALRRIAANNGRVGKFLEANGDMTPDTFAVRHVAEALRHKSPPPLERLLLRVDDMAKHAEAQAKPPKILVFLSFPAMTEWVWDQNMAAGGSIRQELWANLAKFGTDNLDHNGNLSGRSHLKEVSRAALLIELRKVDLPALSDAFCKNCLLAVPPLSDHEVRKLWKQRTAKEMAPEVADEIRTIAGGQPFFVDALLRLVAAEPKLTTDPMSQSKALAQAYEQLLAVMIDGNGSSASANKDLERVLPRIRNQWRLYLAWLRLNLPPATLNNDGPLLQLQKLLPQGGMPIVPEVSDWLASGFVWLRPPSGEASLHAFEHFPELEGHVFPQIVNELVAHMRSQGKG